MDRVTGPFDGCFVASSASEMGSGSGRYLGFAKVSCRKPASFWLATLCEEPGCCAHLCGGGLFDTPEAALASAELLARNHLRGRQAAMAPHRVAETAHAGQRA
jgi:hypothetical protein